MNKSEFYYELPERLIAQTPLSNRSQSSLMLLNKTTGQTEHKTFSDIVGLLNPNDCLVLNNTKVIPARLIGEKSGRPVEILLLNRKNDMWEVLVKPGKRAKIGDVINFGNNELTAEVIDILEYGNRLVKFTCDTIFEEALYKLGEMPLPPYITEKLQDKNRYQTVYAKCEGSAAAPTAGLHFTKELLSDISSTGVKIAAVTLHVGLGTFRPVKENDILQHKMHSEFFILEQSQADIINQTKKNGGRIICVGTTSCRVLETCAQNGFLTQKSGWTDIFIYPGYKFNIVDCLITNFHLPESTLIMLVSAMAGKENVLNAYIEAINNEYRFFSFGDAMFIY